MGRLLLFKRQTMSENPFENQIDITKTKLLHDDSLISSYKVKQMDGGKPVSRWVRVLHDISNHYAIKREKDLLIYLNQFKEDFVRFDEIRKVHFNYLQFFDYVGKKTLLDRVKKSGHLSEKQAKRLLENVISALEKIHGVGFVHNNIRPESIFDGKDHYYLFAMNHVTPMLSGYESELLIGDQRYTAPERMNGKVSEASDIYALGCTLYFAMTGKHIYRLKAEHDRYQQLYAHAFHSMRKENSLPYFWRQLIIWMTQKQPEKRPSLADLKQWLEDQLVPKFIRDEVISHNKKLSKTPLEDLASRHYLFAQFKRANEYELEGNLDSAFNLYESGAFQEYSRSENNLGLMYEKGKPVKQDYMKAMNYYYMAYQKGNPYAAYNLGRMFEKGIGTHVDVQKAFKLYQFSALRGHRPAQHKMGSFYAEGQGMPKNLIQARFWFGLAARYGCLASENSIKKILMASF